jgi:hypothetical protein
MKEDFYIKFYMKIININLIGKCKNKLRFVKKM